MEPELAAGTLVQVWDYASKGRGAYYMAYPLSLERTHKTKVMVDWIQQALEHPSATLDSCNVLA